MFMCSGDFLMVLKGLTSWKSHDLAAINLTFLAFSPQDALIWHHLTLFSPWLPITLVRIYTCVIGYARNLNCQAAIYNTGGLLYVQAVNNYSYKFMVNFLLTTLYAFLRLRSSGNWKPFHDPQKIISIKTMCYIPYSGLFSRKKISNK